MREEVLGLMKILLIWIINSISLFLISKLPVLGVRVDSFGKSMVAAAVFGILNATVGLLMRFITTPLNWLSLGLVYFIINAFIFGLAAKLIKGFRLEHGIWSALMGAFAFGLLNTFLTTHLLAAVIG